MTTLRIGTRGSDLAMWQARHVRQSLLGICGDLAVELRVISTRGDRAQGESLAKIPGKGLFTKEIEESLLSGQVDIAVHSLKDLPTDSPPGLVLAAIMEREDPADALVAKGGLTLQTLPAGAKVMTGSPRRQGLLVHARSDLTILPAIGNVPTRIRKFNESDADAIVLARAGLVRLGLDALITQRLDPVSFPPACGQGALAIQVRSSDSATVEVCRTLDHMPTRLAVTAERAFLAGMGGGCRAPMGAYARFDAPNILIVTAMVSSTDGRRFVCREESTSMSGHAAISAADQSAAGAADAAAAIALGERACEMIRGAGIEDILALAHSGPDGGYES